MHVNAERCGDGLQICRQRPNLCRCRNWERVVRTLFGAPEVALVGDPLKLVCVGEVAEVNASCESRCECNLWCGERPEKLTQSAAGSHDKTNGNAPPKPAEGAATSSSFPFDHPLPEGTAKTLSSVLGEVTWLMSQSPLHKRFFIEDLEWFVMTPALLQQFRLFYAQDRPLGVVLWANVSPEVEKMLTEGTTKLGPQDWKSGDQAWVVEVIAPFGGAEEMVKDLKAKVFPSRELKYLDTKDGKREVKVA